MAIIEVAIGVQQNNDYIETFKEKYSILIGEGKNPAYGRTLTSFDCCCGGFLCHGHLCHDCLCCDCFNRFCCYCHHHHPK